MENTPTQPSATQPPPPTTPPPSITPLQESTQTSNTMTIVTIVLLLFAPLFGVICMWIWTTWSKKVKWIITSILIILPIISIIVAITLISANPSKQFSQADNTKRRSDVSHIQNGISNFKTANNTLPTGISNTPQVISNTGADICTDLVPEHMPALPVDPSIDGITDITDCTNTYNTGYMISVDASGKVTVSAPSAELNEEISATQ